ncbi:MAG TPA: hypothetical protein VH763_19750 [Gemmatimonadales bacterium]|jgi:hypothetical protein
MRSVAWLTGLVVLGGLSGCGGDRRVESAQVRPPARDLTQPAEPAAVTVASPVELGRAQPHSSSAHPKRTSRKATLVRKTPSPTLAAPAPEPVITVIPAVLKPITGPVAPAAEPAGIGHELAPGETVTIIPASSGPSTDAGEGVGGREGRAGGGVFIGGGHGGTCRPRGGVRGFRLTI